MSDLEKQIEVCNLAMPIYDLKTLATMKADYFTCNASRELKKCEYRHNPDNCSVYKDYYQHLYRRG